MSGRPVTLNTGFTQADFDALLDSGAFSYAEAVTVKLASGTIKSWTNAQQTFTSPQCNGDAGLRTYVANDVLMSGFKFQISNGTDSQGGDPTTSITVDEASIAMAPNANPAVPTLLDGVPFITALRQRALAGAVIQRDRWYFDAPGGTPVGGMPMFYGLAGQVSPSETQAIVKVRADTVLLNIAMPRNLFQPNCQYTIYSTGCGADKSAFGVSDVVGPSPSLTFIPWTSAGGQYVGGEIAFTSGPAIGQSRTIVKADGTGLWLAYPLYNLPLASDHFTAYPGCNRLDPLVNPSDSGCVFFSRQAAFRATPNVPGAVYGV